MNEEEVLILLRIASIVQSLAPTTETDIDGELFDELGIGVIIHDGEGATPNLTEGALVGEIERTKRSEWVLDDLVHSGRIELFILLPAENPSTE